MKEENQLKRTLNLPTVILLVVANTFSGSIFVLLAEGAGAAGTLLPLSYIFGAFLAFMIGAIYAEVTTSIPEAGASLAYSFSAYGRGSISFILSWLSILGNITYGAVNAIGFGLYLAVFLSVPPFLVAIAIVVVFTLINLRGVGVLGSIGKWSVLLSMGLMGIFVILVLTHLDYSLSHLTGLFAVPSSSYLSILAGTALIFSAFIGFEGVSSLAREIKDPDRNIPRALFSVIGITGIVYVGVAFLTVYGLPINDLSNSSAPLSLLAEENGGGVATIIIAIAALLATATALLMDILISSRKVFAAAEEGYLPAILKRISKKGTPYLAVTAVGVSILVFILTNSVAFIAYLGNAAYLFFASMLTFATMIMRKKRPYLKRPFHLPLFPAVPIITILLALLVILNSSLIALFWLLVWIFAGFVLYLASLLPKDRMRWFFYGIGGALFVTLLFAGLLYYFVF